MPAARLRRSSITPHQYTCSADPELQSSIYQYFHVCTTITHVQLPVPPRRYACTAPPALPPVVMPLCLLVTTRAAHLKTSIPPLYQGFASLLQSFSSHASKLPRRYTCIWPP